MHISKLNISGYKNAKVKSEIEFSKGLNILVGENGAGKTTIINALRLALKENEYSYMNICCKATLYSLKNTQHIFKFIQIND